MSETERASVRTSEILNLTVGRVTNETLEKVTAVSWKSEGENEGPIYLEVEGDGSGYGNLQPFHKGEAEWFASETAEQLAAELGVPVRYV